MRFVDTLLNRVSMYRLVIYFLTGLVVYAAVLSAFAVLPYSAWDIVLTAVYLVVLSVVMNWVFARIAGAYENKESAVISALILSLIIGPLALSNHLLFVTFVAAVAMASKYVVVWRGRHIFNPAAVGVLASAVVLGQGASWWIGAPALLPLVALFGILLTRKIGRGAMVSTFLASYLVLFFITNTGLFASFETATQFLWRIAAFTPILFFVFIMLPEPQTSPKQYWNSIGYAFMVAVAFIFFQSRLAVPYTLELALLAGNMFTFALERTARVRARLRETHTEAPTITSFWFDLPRPIRFTPGQFFEWTLHHSGADSRGIRRYFTAASSPTEEGILLTTKFSNSSSSFKKALRAFKPGDELSITGPQGDFVLPKDSTTKCAFIAGGIGVTPFRSMVQYLSDNNEERDIVLLYAARTPDEFVFTDLFDNTPGVRVVYAVSDAEQAGEEWRGEVGLVDAEMIRRVMPDWQERVYYISGPEPMVRALSKEVARMGVSAQNVRHDYFPGYEEI